MISSDSYKKSFLLGIPVVGLLIFLATAANGQPLSPSVPSGFAMMLNVTIHHPSNTTICLPFGGSTNVSVKIFWGDGSDETITSAGPVFNVNHVYTTNATYSIYIDRFGPGPVWLEKFAEGSYCWESLLQSNNSGFLQSIETFGDLGIKSLRQAFVGCNRLERVPSNLPSTVTDLGFAFARSSINGGSMWNVSLVTDMEGLFSGTTVFNEPLASWDVSNVLYMQRMFEDAQEFNQSLNGWNVAHVRTFAAMFKNAVKFNSPINQWNTSSATEFGEMFRSEITNPHPFNQPVGSWDVSSVTNFFAMFFRSSFNQPLSNWNVGRGQKFDYMFSRSPFNQPLASWNTHSAQSFNSMFDFAIDFDQPIGNWNTSAVTTMARTFYQAQLFNQSINAWDVSRVTDFSAMFQQATSFNRPLNLWDVGQGTNFDTCFFGAESFQQDISNWCAPRLASPPSSFAPSLAAQFQPNLTTCPLRIRPSMSPNAERGTCPTTTCILETIVISSNSSTQSLRFDNSTTIYGDFRITTPASVVTVRLGPNTTDALNGTISISGCALFDGVLTLIIDESIPLLPSQPLIIATFAGGFCGSRKRNPSQFDSFTADLGCRTAAGSSLQYNPTSLAIAFDSINSNGCSRGAASGAAPNAASSEFPLIPVAIGITAFVVVVAVVVGIFLVYRRRNRLASASQQAQARLQTASLTK